TSNDHNDRNVINLLDIASGKVLRTLRGHTKAILCPTFSPDGKTIAATDYNDDLKLWDVETGKDLDRFKTKPKGSGSGRWAHLVFSPDGGILAIATEDGSVHLMDVKTGEEVRQLVPTSPALNHPSGLAYSPDGRLIAVSPEGRNVVAVWDLRVGKPLWQMTWPIPQDPEYPGTGRPDQKHPPGIYNLAFAADGRSLVAACSDRSIRMWEIATGGLRFQVEHSLIDHTV